MFGFGPMSSFYDEDFERRYDPTEPFSGDEFTTHSDRELDDLDAGRNCDDYYCETCPDCGNTLRFRAGAVMVHCRNCGGKFRVN